MRVISFKTFVILSVITLFAVPVEAQIDLDWGKWADGRIVGTNGITVTFAVSPTFTITVTDIISNTSVGISETVHLTETLPAPMMLKSVNLSSGNLVTDTDRVIWSVPLDPGEAASASKSYEVRPGAEDRFVLEEDLSNGEKRNIIFVREQPPPPSVPSDVPTLTQWGVILFAFLLVITSLIAIRRKRRA